MPVDQTSNGGQFVAIHYGADDKGVFVMLDGMPPTRQTTAFPPGVEIQRLGLAEAIRQTRSFLKD